MSDKSTMKAEHINAKAVLVFGMHRSGTSAFARVLNLLGANLGERLIGGIEGNNRNGFWEHADAVDINDRLLRDLGRSWHDVRELPVDWLNSSTTQAARKQIQNLVRSEFSNSRIWALKDPRLCLLAELWKEVLQVEDFEVVPILVLRHPEEVAKSLYSRDGMTKTHAYILWGMYVLNVLRVMANHKISIIDYAGFLHHWREDFAKAVIPCGLDLPIEDKKIGGKIRDFLDESERHNRVLNKSRGSESNPLVETVDAIYELLSSRSVIDGEVESVKVLCTDFERIAKVLRGPLFELFEHVQMHAQRATLLESRLARMTEKIESAVAVEHELTFEKSESSRLQEKLTFEISESSRLQDELIFEKSESSRLQEKLTFEISESSRRQDELTLEKSESSRLQDELTLEKSESSRLQGDLTFRKSESFRLGQERETELGLNRQATERLERLLRQKEELVSELVRSTSWRVTTPLRWVKTLFLPKQPAMTLGDGLKAMYVRLPLAAHRRVALKGMVFHALAPMIRTTRSYRAWQAYEAQRGASVEPRDLHLARPRPVAAGTVSADATEVSGNFAARVLTEMQAVAGSVAVEHVPLDDNPADLSRIDVRAIAFYLPQFHPIPENDEWWGRGFTEWTNVSKAMPQFVGHYQPRLPGELGFYDLRLVDVMRRQVELAKHYGLQGFCFHYYWFAGRRLLERPMQQFLDNKDIDFPFCVCWANENWSRRWDGQDQDILMAQRHSPEDDVDFIVSLEPLLRDSRYIRVDGRPLIVLYRPSILPDAAATLERWRQHCREIGIGEIFLAMVQFDVEDPRTYGFDVAIEFPPHKLASGLEPINDQLQIVNPDYSGYVIDYGTVIDRARECKPQGFNLIRGVFPSWDNEARKPGGGYTFANATPERYREWLGLAVDYARSHPVAGESLVFINAWNEWGEGAYLEPDRRYGYAYLQQTRETLLAEAAGQTTKTANKQRIVIISHDAKPHGAQYLALNLVRELTTGLGMQVDVLLMTGGHLAAAFAEVAVVHDLSVMSPIEFGKLLTRLRAEGIDVAIANTAVSGRIIAPVKAAGFKIVTLVHELPRLIRDYGLESTIRDLVEYSDRVVLPSNAVLQGVGNFASAELLATKAVVRPQGLFTHSRYRGLSDLSVARSALRQKLGLPLDAKIVLAVGYADRRKGVDLLLKAAAICCADDPMLHFVWVGHLDVSMERENAAQITRGQLLSRFHFVGLDFDTDDYYAGADLYALPSREDPFPSVVLESLSVGVPIVAFAGTGGGADLVKRGCGVVIPAFDVEQYARAIMGLLSDDGKRNALGKFGINLVDDEFSFRSYAIDLLRHGGMKTPRISVVVPNFNYARYLQKRLAGITEQTIPLYEIIFLDDGSSDDSVEVMQTLRHSIAPEPRVVIDPVNSGSVFRQWLRGVGLARGDYVWIAEADDLARPDFLEHMLAGMQDDPDVVLGYCQSEAIDERGNVLMPDYLAYTDDLSATRWLNSYVAEGADEVNTALAIKNSIPNVSAVLFRRQPLLDVLNDHVEEIVRLKVAGDWLVYLNLLRHGKIFYDAVVGNSHRRHAHSVTGETAATLHYQEVLETQRAAESMFSLTTETMQAAHAYLASVRGHFGLSEARDKTA